MNDDSPQSVEAGRSVWAALRILVGSIFLWSFFDKLFGLGFNTAADASWLANIEYRQWSDKSGEYTLVARLLNAADSTVRLEMKDGSPKKIRLDRLSNADKEYVQLVIPDAS